jgi:predicted negative regulator of RcsB-dependent stress response
MNEIYDNDSRFVGLQSFFTKYKTILLISFVSFLLAFAITFSMNFIAKNNNEKAALIFNEWSDFVSKDDEANAQIKFDELISLYKKTGYTKIALLEVATKQASNGDIEGALAKYSLLIDLTDGFKGNKIYNKLARVSSARLLASKEQFDEALAMLDKYSASTTNAYIHELTGDILVKKEQLSLAKEQYLKAENLYRNETSKSIVAMKLANLK